MRGRQSLGAFYTVILLLVGVWEGGVAQTIVSTDVQKKRAVLEYFRGIYCVYCPEADLFAANLQSTFAEAVIPINIYAGDYSYPIDPYALDLRSSYGQGIHDISGLVGYPAGMVNRRNFTGLEQGASGSFAINRNRWTDAVEQLIEEDAPVNIGLSAQYDINSREMEIQVEVYYTASINTPSQALHIAVLQDSIRTLQAGSSHRFNYFHSNVLRDMVTGENGVTLGSRNAGELYSQTFQYTLPTDLFNTPLEASEIRLVAYVTEERENILNATTHTPNYQATQDNDLNLLSTYFPTDPGCGRWINPTVLIRNDGKQVVEDVLIEYSINDGPEQYYEWPGELKTFEKTRVSLPEISFGSSYNLANALQVKLKSTGSSIDENQNNNIIIESFYGAPTTDSWQVRLELATDNFGYETYWEIVNSAEEVVAQGGNLLVGISEGGKQVGASTNPGVYANNQTVEEVIALPGPGCYTFRLVDDYGDGFCCGFGEGFYRLRDELGEVLFSGNRFGVTREIRFELEPLTALQSDKPKVEDFPFQVFPNPIRSEQLQLSFALSKRETVQFDLKDANGSALKKGVWANLPPNTHHQSISLQTVPAGVYFLTLRAGQAIRTEKIIRIN